MISKKILSNLFLIVFLIFIIFFYIFYLNENKGTIKIEDVEQKNLNIAQSNTVGVTSFLNIEYKITDKNNKNFMTKGEKAYFKNDNPNLIKLTGVHSYTTLSDGSILNIKSDKADYFKVDKNIKYYGNVIITNKEGMITTEIANYMTSKDLLRLEENVIFKDTKNVIRGDIAEFNTATNNLQIFMKNKKTMVYGRRDQK